MYGRNPLIVIKNTIPMNQRKNAAHMMILNHLLNITMFAATNMKP